MQKITNLKYLQPGEAINFDYKGQNAILVRPEEEELVAYVAICPHEQERIEWDKELHKLLCECHMSLFNVEDGTVYKHSSIFENIDNLTPVDIEVDDDQNVYAV